MLLKFLRKLMTGSAVLWAHLAHLQSPATTDLARKLRLSLAYVKHKSILGPQAHGHLPGTFPYFLSPRRNYEGALTEWFMQGTTLQLSHKMNPFRALGQDEDHKRTLQETSLTLPMNFYLDFRQLLDAEPSKWMPTPKNQMSLD
ncbi:hypothetical protein CLF_113211 [Clonorchis sinensis]|uniref:Uncharacterized protein n=1 Tax=Clonorchis sinensis TaxID=79923 RepID=G7YXW8_CLOSI|nr:hypothetical protein CLF_113211 [Clonorchis sinensis]